MQSGNIEILKKMVEVGLGVSIVPRFSVQSEVEHGQLRALPITDYSFKRPLALIHRKGKPLSRPIRAFIDLLTEGVDTGEPAVAEKNGRE